MNYQTEDNQSKVAYEDSPKEIRDKKGMPNSQFKGEKVMPQTSNKVATKSSKRHHEHR